LEKEHHKSLSHVWFMMVKRVEHAGGELFACEVCGLVYRDFEHALVCEEFCRSHPGRCSRSASARAVGRLLPDGSLQLFR